MLCLYFVVTSLTCLVLVLVVYCQALMVVHLCFITSFDILCFMHKVSGHNFKKEKNLRIFFNGSGHWLSRSGRVDLKKKKKSSRVTGQPVFASSQKNRVRVK